MKRAHIVAMKRSKLVYTGDTQPKESLLRLHTISSPTYQVKIGESEVMHVGCSGASGLWATGLGTLLDPRQRKLGV